MQWLDDNEQKIADVLIQTNSDFKKIYEEHIDIDKKLDKFTTKPFLTPEEQKTIKELKLKKLNGNDIMNQMIKSNIING
ncbi:MAG: DUF465 domain-containing protein [Candidatus Acididesulfobacter guangdongensis]|jgi:uncharacterized protein YdcH (DUF465 family)|uniref:DUF465 domain-containing protein n=1 Tax=Acididesulfobacter guangdongensis TaxID=2597225 RepID=A0A519BI84_ACIG2|nr:MAG: DUF465 domain-containing protein [Candidatus Acididesulfobacter guangdongensis]